MWLNVENELHFIILSRKKSNFERRDFFLSISNSMFLSLEVSFWHICQGACHFLWKYNEICLEKNDPLAYFLRSSARTLHCHTLFAIYWSFLFATTTMSTTSLCTLTPLIVNGVKSDMFLLSQQTEKSLCTDVCIAFLPRHFHFGTKHTISSTLHSVRLFSSAWR